MMLGSSRERPVAAEGELWPELDEVVELTARVCGTSMSAAMVVDDHGVRLTAAVGVPVETGMKLAGCHWTIGTPGTFVVEDAAADARFASHPLVMSGPRVRLYAGMPVVRANGRVAGAICVADRVPRELELEQVDALELAARQVSALLELRAVRREAEKARARMEAASRENEELGTRLRASEELFRTFMNNSPMASFIKDAEGRYVFCNLRYAESFGVTAELYPGLDSLERCLPDEDAGGNQILERMEEVRRSDGRVMHWKTFQFPCRGEDGRPLLGCVAIDVTGEKERSTELARYQADLEAANDRLRNLAVTDDLTGLKNRRAFEERLAFEFSMARRKRRELSVVLIDADDFKKVNDRLGHAAGDSVLQQLGGVLRDTVRLTDLAVRFGGEEFAVILPETDERSALGWCRRFQRALDSAPWQYCRVTVSMGVAGLSAECTDGSHLVQLADQALYRAKRQGKNRSTGSSEAERAAG